MISVGTHEHNSAADSIQSLMMLTKVIEDSKVVLIKHNVEVSLHHESEVPLENPSELKGEEKILTILYFCKTSTMNLCAYLPIEVYVRRPHRSIMSDEIQSVPKGGQTDE